MSKARCIRNTGASSYLTVDKVYDVLIDDDGLFVVIEDDGKCGTNPSDRFQLLPDEPKAEWMRERFAIIEELGIKFDNIASWAFSNESRSVTVIYDNGIGYDAHRLIGKYADAFAALVGYDWGTTIGVNDGSTRNLRGVRATGVCGAVDAI